MSQTCIRPGCPNAAVKRLFDNPSTTFCPDCGARLQPVTNPDPAITTAGRSITAFAPRGPRIGAYLLDVIISVVLGFVALVPVIGQLIGGILLTIFWLFRDVNGASPGKMICGLTVVNRSGGPSTTKQRILRNFPFAISIAPLVIPVLGYEIAAVLQLLCIAVEVLMVLSTGDRLTDRLVGTKVVKGPGVIE